MSPFFIYTVNALAGAAKTYNAIRVACAGTRAGGKYIFCVPTTDLAVQDEKDCRAAGCEAVTAIHSQDCGEGSVVARLNKHFQEASPDRGEILILTLAALERLKYIERRGQWELIVDELPSPVFYSDVSLHENRHHLLDLIAEAPWNAAYTMLSASETDTGHVMDVARNRWSDQITQQVGEIANKLLSPHWHCFALNDQLARFKTPGNKKNVVEMFGLLQPSIFAGFKSVTLMGACLDQMLLYRHWLSLGIEFRPHPTIKPRFTQYENGGLVTIQYAIDRDWSAKLRDTEGVFDNIISRCKTALNGEPYVYLANKGLKISELADGVQLPHVSHGLNEFGCYHNAMLLSALNPPPSYFGFCNDMMGINGEEVRTAIYRAAIYQAALRISIRNTDDTNPKRMQVVDRATAIWLGGLIQSAKIEKLPGHDPAREDRRRVDVPKTTAERLVTFKANAKTELLAGLDEVNQMGRNDILYTKHVVSPLPHVGAIFDSIFSKYGDDTSGISVLSLRGLLAEAHTDVIGEKDDRSLICPGSFDPHLGETCRGNENLLNLSGVWLDNDGGDLSHDDFAKMLKVPLVIFNSFSSTKEAPRWRVWIPTSHLITPAVHKELIAQITKMLIRRGYYGKRYIKKNPDRQVKHHGFDEGKFAPASLFFLPAQAKAGKDASFFLEHNWNASPLNPYQWIERSIADHRPPVIIKPVQPPSEAPETVNEAKIAKANENWQTHAAGDGNVAFFKLAVAYRHAGLSWYEAEPLLRAQAHLAHGSGSIAARTHDLARYHRKIWHS